MVRDDNGVAVAPGNAIPRQCTRMFMLLAHKYTLPAYIHTYIHAYIHTCVQMVRDDGGVAVAVGNAVPKLKAVAEYIVRNMCVCMYVCMYVCTCYLCVYVYMCCIHSETEGCS